MSDPAQHDTRLAAETLRDALLPLRTYIPGNVSLNFPAESAIVEDTTGEMVELTTFSPPLDPFDGISLGEYSAASGALVSYRTGAVRRGRRVNGRTFLVPLKGNAYEDDGTLSAPALSALRSFASAIEDPEGPQFLVWSRPIYDRDTGALIEQGSSHRISSASVVDRVAVLRSRRD